MADDIADRLQKVRQMYGLSQRELAKRAGVTNSSISMIEQGRVSPQISSLEKLLSGIPMSIVDFFSININDHSRCFYSSHNLELTSKNKIDHYMMATDRPKRLQHLSYEVHEPDSDTGEVMMVYEGERSGFVVKGTLEVTINCQCELLHAGDGFYVESRQPHRLRNRSDDSAIVVMTNFPQLT